MENGLCFIGLKNSLEAWAKLKKKRLTFIINMFVTGFGSFGDSEPSFAR